MSLSRGEVLALSPPSPPPAFPRLFRQRIRDLGYGSQVDRDGLKELCGSASAANQFLDKAAKAGVLVPIAWGEYQVADERTLALISRVGHEPYQRFISWSRHLEDFAGRQVLFVAPYLWRDTELNIEEPMPLIPLTVDEQRVQGLAPQWDAFYMDVDEPRDWTLVIGEDEVATFRTPGPVEVVLLLMASLDSRWREAAGQIDGAPGAERLGQELNRMRAQPAPRGSGSKTIGMGPPHRRRFLVPPWYMDMIQDRLTDAALSLGDR